MLDFEIVALFAFAALPVHVLGTSLRSELD
jgi:hypothetical protein